MDNYKKFFKITDTAIDIFSESIGNLNQNFNYEKTKIMRKIKDYSNEDKIEFFLTWQFLLDFTLLGLNREKIEKDVTINWDNYVPKNFNDIAYQCFKVGYSKIEYFYDWLKVLDCKNKYLTEDSRFWILKVRNSLMHGNFYYDYDRVDKMFVRILEGNASSTDVNIKMNVAGFHEFVEDNFHNVEHNEYGISSEYLNFFMFLDNKRILNREQLIQTLKNKVLITKRKVSSNFYYNGNDIINAETNEKVDRNKKTFEFSLKDNELQFKTNDFIDSKTEYGFLQDAFVDDLVWVLENKYNIYNTSKQKKAIFEALEQFAFPMKGIYKLLREFGCYCGEIARDKQDHADDGLNIKKTYAVLNQYKDQIENAFIILRLYKLLYRLQNKSMTPLECKYIPCNETFAPLSESSQTIMQERLDKYQTKIDTSGLTEEEAQVKISNKAYIETLRNALAHGNIEIRHVVCNNRLKTVFMFTDDWTNSKTGERKVITITSTPNMLTKLLDGLDMEDQSFDLLSNIPDGEEFTEDISELF